MRLCVIGTRGFPYIEGGVEKHCESIYPLLSNDIEITVFRRKPYVNGNTAYSNTRFIDLPSTRIKGFEALFHSFLATLYTLCLRPDVVHVHNIGPALFVPLLKLFSVPVVLTYHSANYEHAKWGFFAKKLLYFCEKVSLKYADKIIFVNRFQMQKYPAHIQQKSVYIPNGIPTPSESKQHDCLDKMGLQPRKYILSVGRVTPEKGYHTLIRAFKSLNLDGYTLVIAGGMEAEAGYTQELLAQSKDSSVLFTGYVFGEALSQLYANAALFVLASENEGFPLVLLEAMSYKRDIIVSDIPATHLVALEPEDYFPKGNVEELSRKLRKKLAAPCTRTYDLSAYDWTENAAQLSSILHEVAQNKSS